MHDVKAMLVALTLPAHQTTTEPHCAGSPQPGISDQEMPVTGAWLEAVDVVWDQGVSKDLPLLQHHLKKLNVGQIKAERGDSCLPDGHLYKCICLYTGSGWPSIQPSHLIEVLGKVLACWNQEQTPFNVSQFII